MAKLATACDAKSVFFDHKKDIYEVSNKKILSNAQKRELKEALNFSAVRFLSFAKISTERQSLHYRAIMRQRALYRYYFFSQMLRLYDM